MKLISDLIIQLQNNDIEIWMSAPASDASIAIIEKSLNVSLPIQYRKFLSKYGALSIGAEEAVIGILDDNPITNEGGNIISELEYLKKSCNQLPAGVIPIQRHEDGAYCFDFRANDKNDEPIIVNMEHSFKEPQKIASCFLEFIVEWIIAPELEAEDLNFLEYEF